MSLSLDWLINQDNNLELSVNLCGIVRKDSKECFVIMTYSSKYVDQHCDTTYFFHYDEFDKLFNRVNDLQNKDEILIEYIQGKKV